MDIRDAITEEINKFVVEENAKCRLSSCKGAGTEARGLWQEPLIGFADAKGEYIGKLREIVHPKHQLPEEVMADAKTVICYFVPFAEWVAASNTSESLKNASDMEFGCGSDLSSPQWAESYELANAMMTRLNEHIADFIHKLGYEAKPAPEAAVFYRDEVISHWSFRHLAYAAGLGTFGLNNMLITDKGCSGRYNCIVTDLEMDFDEPKSDEVCSFKKDGSCGACMIKCPAGAISPDGFDRHKCYEQCLKNAAIYTEFGSSYADEQSVDDAKLTASQSAAYGSEVCGKCIAGMPCAHKRP